MLKPLIALYFFILGAIQLGLWLGLSRTYQSKNLVKPSPFWVQSLVASILALFFFGAAVLFVKDVGRPQFGFTIANTLFYIAALSQWLFCRSLNHAITSRFNSWARFSIIPFFIVFELLRQYGSYELRTFYMVSLAFVMFSMQIFELQQFKKKEPSSQLTYMQIATGIELLLALTRAGILIFQAVSIRKVEQLPEILIVVTVAQLVANTLAYIAMGGYWSEKMALSRAKILDENEVIKNLLSERDELISSLLIANKTAATGALSASIAHELNQPVAAISLNTEYMERQMKEGRLNPEAFKEVIQNIQQDNQRIANIVSTLRDIFRQDEIKTSHVDLDELIEQIKPIIAPRARDLNIQMSFDLRVSQLVPLNSNEISQVILNLVNNAVDALTTADIKPKEILIQTQVINQWVELKISDNGPGIPEPLRAGIFDLMKSYKKEGMGLGLWLCKHIIDRHQGRIEYQESPTGGAEFIVQLPLETLKA